MSGYRLERAQTVAGELRDVFGFFENPSNLARITPPWLRFRVRGSTEPRVGRGTVIDYRISWLGLPLSWKSEITEYEPERYFTDTMLKGPYRSWVHRHDFRPVERGVEIVDTVRYTLPLGPLGRMSHQLLIGRQLESIFDYRAAAIEQIFGRTP